MLLFFIGMLYLSIYQKFGANGLDFRRMESLRVERTERSYIEDVLDKYSSIPNIISLAVGSSHWSPPEAAVAELIPFLQEKDTSKYGSIEGLSDLRIAIAEKLSGCGVDMSGLEIAVTCGANQAFINAALAICDDADNATIIAPYYFSHKLALQLAGASITIVPFMEDTLCPDMIFMENNIRETKPSMVVLTNPNNPSGLVMNESIIRQIVKLCKSYGCWLVVDETYHEFIHDKDAYFFPCSAKVGYDKIIHISSFSKAYGMAGWRVGYLAYPRALRDQMRKIQDTVPTHTAILSQKLALLALKVFVVRLP